MALETGSLAPGRIRAQSPGHPGFHSEGLKNREQISTALRNCGTEEGKFTRHT